MARLSICNQRGQLNINFRAATQVNPSNLLRYQNDQAIQIQLKLEGLKMRVLVGCEFSGTVRDAFIRAGHDAMSCDLLPTEKPGPHYHGDIFDVLYEGWADLAVLHPPCTYLSGSGIHWNSRPGHVRFGGHQTEAALAFVRRLMAVNDVLRERKAKELKWALENPIGIISTHIRKASQYIQPHDFGDDASKRTGLWLENLPLLVPPEGKRCNGRWVEWPRGSGKMIERWANQTDSGQNKLGPSEDRWAERSLTYPGIAIAMAAQWGIGLPVPKRIEQIELF